MGAWQYHLVHELAFDAVCWPRRGRPTQRQWPQWAIARQDRSCYCRGGGDDRERGRTVESAGGGHSKHQNRQRYKLRIACFPGRRRRGIRPPFEKSAGKSTQQFYYLSVFFLHKHYYFIFFSIFKTKWPKPEERLKFRGRWFWAAPCHEPQAPFTVTSPRVTIPFTLL